MKSLLLAALLFCPLPVYSQGVETQMLALINQYRTQHGLNRAVESIETCALARERLIETQKEWNHDKFAQRTLVNGYWGENLAQGGRRATNVLKAWKKSPSHNRILLSKMTQACVAYNNTYWVFISHKPTR